MSCAQTVRLCRLGGLLAGYHIMGCELPVDWRSHAHRLLSYHQPAPHIPVTVLQQQLITLHLPSPPCLQGPEASNHGGQGGHSRHIPAPLQTPPTPLTHITHTIYIYT